MNKYKEQLRILRMGCREPIYIGSMNGEEPFNIGWKCGERTYDGIILYCNPCYKRIEKLENKLEKQIKGDDGE